MANERLRDALRQAGLTPTRCAELIGVDPKTVERWISLDRLPHRTHRAATAELLRVDETDLWPAVALDPRTVSAGRAELAEFYPTRAAVPPDLWRSVIDEAQDGLDILVYAGLFLPEVHDVARIGRRARAGCRVRILLGDPSGTAVRQRGEEEGFGIGLAHRVALSLRYFQPIVETSNIEIRLHNTTLYASIVRGDDTLLANIHMYGYTAGQNPVLHLQRVPEGRVFDQYLGSFDKVWSVAPGPVSTADLDEAIAQVVKGG
ncbi:DUF5919 domain-containing protein [Hamadaea sp. NPDC051192]|uniref:DUF5919 domain-containing protein n=1 Tax=Hamadaea sp. NPDC051192 TaxID=3154940 RepID=UPI003421E3BA